MKARYSFAILLLLTCSATATETPRTANETLAAFVGQWQLSLSADAATFGDRAGTGSGDLSCLWGLQQAWIDCELRSVYDGLGHYGLKMVLYRMADPQAIGAFVTNTLGGGRLYVGTWADSRTLVFEDAWIDPAKKWEYQRTTYTFGDNGEMHFEIEVSRNGSDYYPHSGGTYHRAPASSGRSERRR